MPPRNFEQLILAKQLFEDAKSSVKPNDILSLTKAVILMDLAIETTLKTIILNLNPAYYAPRNRQDINWRDAWTEAHRIILNAGAQGLIEQIECSGLRDLRNSLQHSANQPNFVDVRRYLAASERMLVQAFSDAFNLDFSNLRNWDFITDVNLRRFLNECEEYFSNGNLVASVIGCKFVRRLITEKINDYTTAGQNLRLRLNGLGDINRFETNHPTLRYTRPFIDTFEKLKEYLSKTITDIQVESLLTGLNLPVIETRKFMSYEGHTRENYMADGRIHTNRVHDNLPRIEYQQDAQFLLNYLFRLIFLVEERYPDILINIEIKYFLSDQNADDYVNWLN